MAGYFSASAWIVAISISRYSLFSASSSPAQRTTSFFSSAITSPTLRSVTSRLPSSSSVRRISVEGVRSSASSSITQSSSRRQLWRTITARRSRITIFTLLSVCEAMRPSSVLVAALTAEGALESVTRVVADSKATEGESLFSML